MRPSPAEIARTLATGRLLGVAHLRGYPDQLRVRHATGADGRPLLLTPSTGELAAALQPPPGERDVAMVLRVDDIPPVDEAPCYGRLWISGWAARLAGPEARAAAQAYAAVNPCSDLLDVGYGHTLYRMHVAEVRLAHGPSLVELEPEDYLAATPDPLHRDEPELLAELADRRRLQALVSTLTGQPAPAGSRAVRIDQFGLTLACPEPGRRPHRSRVPFPRPVTDRRHLAELTIGGAVGHP